MSLDVEKIKNIKFDENDEYILIKSKDISFLKIILDHALEMLLDDNTSDAEFNLSLNMNKYMESLMEEDGN